jgi:hypothetical protein
VGAAVSTSVLAAVVDADGGGAWAAWVDVVVHGERDAGEDAPEDRPDLLGNVDGEAS